MTVSPRPFQKVAALALAAALSLSAAWGQEAAEQCLDPEVCPVPYVRLATQETEPFLFLGKVVDKDHPRYSDFRRALRRFPNVRSCLIEAEREKRRPDLRQIDWGLIENGQETHVCVFRIASSIEGVEGIKTWFRSQGFRVGELRRAVSEKYVPKYDTDPFYGISAYLTAEQVRKLYPYSWYWWLESLLEWLTDKDLSRGSSSTISFSHSGKVVGVRSGGSSILN